MSKVDKIEELLTSPTQCSGEKGMRVAAETECWRCGCSLDNDGEVGACNRCITDLQNPDAPTVPHDDFDSAMQRIMDLVALQGEAFARLRTTGAPMPPIAASDGMVAEVARIFDLPVEILVGPFPDLAPLARPIEGCEHIDAEDGTCSHPNAGTPECWRTGDGERSDCPPLDGPRNADEANGAGWDQALAMEELRASALARRARIVRSGTIRMQVGDGEPFAVAGFALVSTHPRCVMNDEDECLVCCGGIACAECPRRADG